MLLSDHLAEALRAMATVKGGGFGHESSLSSGLGAPRAPVAGLSRIARETRRLPRFPEVAYDEALADRVRDLISARGDVTEKKMFGGIAFLLGGNMAVGVRGEDLLVRLAGEDAEDALSEDGVRPFEMGSRRRPKGWVLVGPERVSDQAGLAEWVDVGADHAASLPAK